MPQLVRGRSLPRIIRHKGGNDVSKCGWSNPLIGSAVAVLAICVTGATGASAHPAVKAFGPGCWKGTGTYVGSYKKGYVTATVTKGKLLFALSVAKDPTAPVYGSMDTSGHGTGTVAVSGTEIDLEVEMTGALTINGTREKLKAGGEVHWKGVALYNGAPIPIDLTMPMENAALTILTAGPKHVTGKFGKSKWTAGWISGKMMQACYTSVFP
jgi:hypothetical protein